MFVAAMLGLGVTAAAESDHDVDRSVGWSISASGEAEYPYILPLARATGAGTYVHDRLASVAPEPPCTGANKQKALYLQYDWAEGLQASPATALEVTTTWLNVSDIRRYGQNGVFASHPFGTVKGPSGYFGSQADGDKQQGGLLWSIWDAQRKGDPVPNCTGPNATWCDRKHSFPLPVTGPTALTGKCDRHCLDCGLHPGWHNTTGTQCGFPYSIEDGDAFTFRIFQSDANASYTYPEAPGASWRKTYVGSVWEIEVTVTPGSPGSPDQPGTVITMGRVFFEDDSSGIDRLGAFDEHIGCTDCDAFYAAERRTRPKVLAPSPRTVSAVTFNRPNCSCGLFDVKITEATALIETGPGTGPPPRPGGSKVRRK